MERSRLSEVDTVGPTWRRPWACGRCEDGVLTGRRADCALASERARAAAIKSQVGWKTFRHSFRSWLDQTDAPIGVQRELMRHASIQTTMNVYGRAMPDSKRQAHNNVVQMALQVESADTSAEKTLNHTFMWSRMVSVMRFEPPTFGL